MPTKNKIIEWKAFQKENAVVAIWPGTTVREEDCADVIEFFKDKLNTTPTIIGCVTTMPSKNSEGDDIPGTGGRIDLGFYVDWKDIPEFSGRRIEFGMRWWEDVYFNKQEDIYPSEFRAAYPDAKA